MAEDIYKGGDFPKYMLILYESATLGDPYNVRNRNPGEEYANAPCGK